MKDTVYVIVFNGMNRLVFGSDTQAMREIDKMKAAYKDYIELEVNKEETPFAIKSWTNKNNRMWIEKHKVE